MPCRERGIGAIDELGFQFGVVNIEGMELCQHETQLSQVLSIYVHDTFWKIQFP